ncbi:MAG: histidine kinase N-terminal 7TM domain-containing protein [Anaerolineaceae bacterium]|nr:histidine kinase N-terminal 7TM domain-containing protein [Anaerolineaceae bacterium]
MHWQFTSSSSLYVLTAIVTFVSAWMNWRQREQREIATLALSMLFMSFWAIFGALELSVVGIDQKITWVILENFCGGALITLLVIFVLNYLGFSRWLPPSTRWVQWVPVIGFRLIEITNPYHHWVWTQFVPGPPGSNLIYYLHGPAYYISIGYSAVLITIALLVMGVHATRTRGRERFRTIYMCAGLMMPILTSTIYVLWPDQIIGVSALPFGFAACGLLISSIVYDDLQIQVADRTDALQETIDALIAEIDCRKRLEYELRQAQDLLAERLADQSQKMIGLYDIILISSQSLALEDLLAQSLRKIKAVLNSDAVCFYRDGQQFLPMEAQHGLAPEDQVQLQTIPAHWLLDDGDVHATIDTTLAAGLPSEIIAAGFGACLCKIVRIPDRRLGIFCAFWRERHTFSVEEIALFGALSDELGVIMENARLRQEYAQTVTLQERRRLARDLHDSVTQSLHSLVFSAETASQLARSQPGQLENALNHMVTSAHQALKEMRLLLYELRPTSLQQVNLVEALRARLEAVERRARIEACIEIAQVASWPQAWETELYSIAIEALNNTLKYACATRVQVTFKGNPPDFEMAIVDNGRGFDVHSATAGGMGLHSMAERAERLGGRLVIQSEAGSGTKVLFSSSNK